MKLIHCADIHLDSPMQTHMTARQAATRSAEVLRSFVRMTQYARENGVQAVIIAGDLFDGDRVRERTVDVVLDAMQKTPEVDYLYLPGNHDEAANAFCDCALPGNLKLFGGNRNSVRRRRDQPEFAEEPGHRLSGAGTHPQADGAFDLWRHLSLIHI